jgi:hypothetical protein
MREYKRTTHECSFNEFPPEIIAGIRKYAEKNELGETEAKVLMCAETSSEKIKQGFFSKFFGGNFAVKTCVVITPERILWATLNNKNETAVLAARLSEVEIKDFSSNLIEDTGLEIFGFVGGFAERMTVFIGLGEEEAAQKLRRVLKEAAEGTNRK